MWTLPPGAISQKARVVTPPACENPSITAM